MQHDQLSRGDTYLYLLGAAKYHDAWLVKMFSFFSNFQFLCMSVLSGYHRCAVPVATRKAKLDFLELDSRNGCELPHEGWESSPGSMQEHPVL